ncbi:MAG: hypothetical protein P8N50_13265, partial [Actinomycetota bacterium]|nr:hypothetical protein [Actinomycetota bacterium]
SKHLRAFQEAGVDQTVFIQQGGKNRHEHICEGLELFADQVMEPFAINEVDRQARKDEELAPHVEAAFKRKRYMEELSLEDIPVFPAYGNSVAEIDIDSLPEAQRQRALRMRQLREVVDQVDRETQI